MISMISGDASFLEYGVGNPYQFLYRKLFTFKIAGIVLIFFCSINIYLQNWVEIWQVGFLIKIHFWTWISCLQAFIDPMMNIIELTILTAIQTFLFIAIKLDFIGFRFLSLPYDILTTVFRCVGINSQLHAPYWNLYPANMSLFLFQTNFEEISSFPLHDMVGWIIGKR